jgi:hypothetical protein
VWFARADELRPSLLPMRRLMSHRDDRRRDIITASAILACLIVAALLAAFRP